MALEVAMELEAAMESEEVMGLEAATESEEAMGLEAAGVSGRTILGTGWGFLTPIVGWQSVSAELPVRAGDSPVGRLADGRILAAT